MRQRVVIGRYECSKADITQVSAKSGPDVASPVSKRAGNAEGSPIVRIQRRVMPHRLRRALAGRYSPEQRRRIMRALSGAAVGHIVHQASRIGLAALHRYVLAACGGVVATVGARPRIAFVDEQLSPESARRANLGTVTEARETAGIDYFCIRSRDRHATAVAVSPSDRDRTLRALEELCRALPGYLGSHGHPPYQCARARCSPSSSRRKSAFPSTLSTPGWTAPTRSGRAAAPPSAAPDVTRKRPTPRATPTMVNSGTPCGRWTCTRRGSAPSTSSPTTRRPRGWTPHGPASRW